jgi:DNA repair protein RecN (Recombination protein N)
VLVFDEIDTGISGKVADAMGIKLYEMSRQFQIICISHLAQVACYADTHLCVTKRKAKSNRVESSIQVLDQTSSLEELARLVSGGDITQSSIVHAEALRKGAVEKFSN